MKYSKIIAILLFSSFISFYSCNENKTTNAPEQETLKPLEVSEPPTQQNATTLNPATTESAQNAGGVWHYTCSKGCAGGAGSATNCATCGNLLAHNSAYHANTNNTPTTTPTPEPSQNTAGVWHYTCGNGCTGGAGAAGPCGTCGSALAHNTAYHQ